MRTIVEALADRGPLTGAERAAAEIERRGVVIEDLSAGGPTRRVEDLKLARNPSSGAME